MTIYSKVESYTDTIFYEIELTAKYSKLKGQQLFKRYNAELTPEEFTTLSVIIENEKLCQRDLAKIILKDRANTGKLVDNLEKKGLINRELTIKNNRPVKLVSPTEKGLETAKNIMAKISPSVNRMRERIIQQNLVQVKDLLKQLRNLLDEDLETNI